MNAYEINKIFGAVISSVLAVTVIGFLANMLVHPHHLEKSVLDIKVAESDAPAGGAAAAPAVLDPISPLLASANADAGKAVTKNCTSCHTFDKGAKNGVGPNLYGIVGNKRAHADGFGYSPAMVAAGGEWDYEKINAFVANPKAAVPGTRMAFAGLRKPEDRANLIAYLRTLSDSPKPLP
ncbi:MAG: cytochrome c family protein [Proteobacteria bacterium]|nr:cytochrome c family protein [Pseudomonadota bacterium]